MKLINIQNGKSHLPIRDSTSHGPYQPPNKYPSSETYRSIASFIILWCFIHQLLCRFTDYFFHPSSTLRLLHLCCPTHFRHLPNLLFLLLLHLSAFLRSFNLCRHSGLIAGQPPVGSKCKYVLWGLCLC